MNIAFLAATAAGLAGLGGWGLDARTSPVQTGASCEHGAGLQPTSRDFLTMA